MKFLEFDLKKNEYYQPKLYAYLLDTSPEIPLKEKRPAVIVCPGGAYSFKSDREAEPIALQYLAQNMNAFVLQYSVSPNRFPTAVLELAQAVMLVREHAEEWFIDPEKILVLGFSAGGHLAGTLGTMWNRDFFAKALGDSKAWRPDGMILCYPVISMGEFTHEESRTLLLGEDATEADWDALSLEKQVSTDTVPAFLWHTQEDDAVPVENSLFYAMALRKHQVPFELHIYEKGEHGLALCNEMTTAHESQNVPDNRGWVELSVKWIQRLGR
ncbi:MAG: alpha/beta hydrolase [Candidatus Limivivens sp.]|nr:alpha/beta hydrolase [Candidatus Limivivens sp.]